MTVIVDGKQSEMTEEKRVICYHCGSRDVWNFTDTGTNKRTHICFACDESWEAEDEDCLGTIRAQQFYDLCMRVKLLEKQILSSAPKVTEIEK